MSSSRLYFSETWETFNILQLLIYFSQEEEETPDSGLRIPEERRRELIKLSGGYAGSEDEDEITESISELPSFQKPYRAPARQVGKKEKEENQEVLIEIINFTKLTALISINDSDIEVFLILSLSCCVLTKVSPLFCVCSVRSVHILV